MDSEQALPEIPEAKADDLEDVSWALSTAEAMWARGDRAEGVKWVRRAAEAASEAENDARALELAKAAADLTSHLTTQLRGSIDLEEVDPESERPPPLPRGDRPSVPQPPPSVTKQVNVPSRVPAPLTTRSQPPGRGKPLGTNTGRTSRPPAGRTTKDSKRPRRSRENIEPSELGWAPPPDTDRGGISDRTTENPAIASAWDASPTANEMPPSSSNLEDGERRTAVAMIPEARKPGVRISAPPAAAPLSTTGSYAPLSSKRSPSTAPHDPGIVTSQAVRVVVWRDASGVHVAPAGTVVSAIKVDAVLVALEPSADLTAWLSQKTR
jgi:hypothetical protein